MCVCVSLSLNAVLPSIPQCWISIREDHHILHTGWDIECMQDGGWRRGENTDQPVWSVCGLHLIDMQHSGMEVQHSIEFQDTHTHIRSSVLFLVNTEQIVKGS